MEYLSTANGSRWASTQPTPTNKSGVIWREPVYGDDDSEPNRLFSREIRTVIISFFAKSFLFAGSIAVLATMPASVSRTDSRDISMANDPEYRPAESVLLTEGYRQLNSELHRRDPHYGTTGRRYVEAIRSLALRHSVRTILDYGCGKRDLWKALYSEFDVRNFDPAIPEFAIPPEPADLVACIDVLEHVEPEFLETVLRDLARVTIKLAFFTIATRPAGKQLADGTNCHRIVESSELVARAIAATFSNRPCRLRS